MAISCKDIANYFLTLNDEEVGELITNLKLQKLVYYAQGFHLAIEDFPLFPETIEAWAHGPVVPALYHEFKKYGSGLIPVPADFNPHNIPAGISELLDEIYTVFGQYSAWKLRNMTHEEPPWRDAYDTSVVISHESMKKYFKTQIND